MEYSKLTISDKQCERNVLGAILNYNSLLMQLAPCAEAFYHPENATLYKAITAIVNEGRIADVVSVLEYSNRHHIGIDPLLLTEVTNGTCLDATYTQNVMRLDELAARRKVYILSIKLEQAGTNEATDLWEAINKVDEELTAITTASKGDNDDYIVDLTKNYSEPQYLITQDGIGTIPRGDLQAIKAKSKNGKSYLASILAASILGSEAFGFRPCEAETKVLYVDTEQNKLNTARIMRRIHIIMGWPTNENRDSLRAINLRSVATKNRLPRILKEVKRNVPTALFIDGVADLIEDFNDIEQSTKVINALMRLSTEYNTSVICILHENKSKDDNGMKGHLGTMLLQKASDVFQVKKSNGKFDVSITDCRNMSVEDFSFAIDGHGVPFRGMSVKESKEAAKVEELRKLIQKIFVETKQTEISYTDLFRYIMTYSGKSERTAKGKVAEALDLNILGVAPNTGNYVQI